jgi:cytochrome b
MTTRIRVWDPALRLFHWALVTGFLANALFTNPERDLHHIIGLAVLGLVVARLIWGLIGPRHARFADFPPDPSASMGQLRDMSTGRRHVHLGHSPLGALMVYNMLLTFLAIGVTGYMQTTVAWFGVEWVEEAHEVLVTWAEISAALHVAAVLFESRRLGINLPKAMVTGYKDLRGPLTPR